MLTRIPLSLLAVIVLSGSTTFACSSGLDDSIFEPNSAPVAISTSFTTAAAAPFSGFLQARDDDGDPLTFEIVTPPALGTVELVDPVVGQFRYESDVAGTDSFAFRVNDGRDDSNLGMVSVTVTSALAFRPAAVAREQPSAVDRLYSAGETY